MRDVAAIAALPAVWANDDPMRVADSLAGALLHVLGLRFVFVRLAGRPGGEDREIVRIPEGAALSNVARELAEKLAPWLDASFRTVQSVPSPVESRDVRLIVYPLGREGETGLLAAAADRPDFPTHEERLMIGVGVNQAAMVIQLASERSRSEATQHRLLEAAESERERLAKVFDLSPAYSAILKGPNHVFDRANDRYYQLVGHRDIIGKSMRDAIPEVQGQGYLEILDRVFQTGEPFVGTDMRLLLRREPDGPLEERYVDFVYQPLRDRDGAVSGILIHGIDLTDGKRAEAGQALMAAIVESSDDAIVSKTLDGRIVSWNAGAERIFGYAAHEAVGRLITLIIPPEREHEERLILERIRRGERVDHLETVRVSKQGRRLDISVTVSPVRDAAGRVVAVSKVARDITDRKRAETALREADRRKDDFIALLAHELRNPLAPLRNGLNMLRLAGSDANAVSSARDMMERQLSHMVRLVDDLLDVSRISRNKIELRRSRVQLADVVSSAVETARPLIDAAQHELTVSLPQRPIFLDADLTRLAQVFSNLLTNSAKYTEPGGRIWLSAQRGDGEVVVTVGDTGIGIPADALPRIFDMFSQVGRSVERSTGGLGIGLALVKGLVEMHDGKVTAESAGQGQGTTLTVTLPMLESKPAALEPLPADQAQTGAAPKRRVLVVDDNRDSAASMTMMLTLMGNAVSTAHNGVEALEAAERFRPEVVLMDVGMPRLNGYDATRRIREQPWGREMTIVALTGWGQETDRLKSEQAGCDGHLVKPVNLHDLETLLTDLSGGAWRQQPRRES